MVYLFIGQDANSKDIMLKRIKQEHLLGKTQEFNSDTLYGEELTLKTLQEALLYLPVNAKKRLVVIKNPQGLKQEARAFLLNYAKKPNPGTVLVLDSENPAPKDEFTGQLARHAKVFRFKTEALPDTFVLCRQIESRRPDYALKTLNLLLEKGEKPEWILGGLRYHWEKTASDSPDSRKRLRLLLSCDMDIKTGRLKPNFALEKLVIALSAQNRRP